LLVIENLSRHYGERAALESVSLTVRRGSFIGVIGRSGAGKSTLLRMINRLVEPSEGRISWDGVDVTALRGRALQNWRASCAMVFQQFNLSDRLDVLTNVLVGRVNRVPTYRSLLGLWPAEDRAVALSVLEQLDMGALSMQRTGQLSGGQQQRVAIARALVQEPELILADEPIASLDPRNSQAVMDALAGINRRYGITVLCNLHSLDTARAYCDRLVGLAAGRVVFDGAPDALTDAVARELYGLEAAQVVGAAAGGRAVAGPPRIGALVANAGAA